VQNEPGVLSRVSGILAGRGFNIDSLVVCRTEIRDLSRMCIVISGQDGVVEQARRQLEDLVRYPPSLPTSRLFTQNLNLHTHTHTIPYLCMLSRSGTSVGRSRLYRDARDPARVAPG
jgi:AHAS-like ACT domain-containing protein